MHNIKRKIMGSLMAVLMGTSTILGTCPAPIFATSASTVEVDSEATQVNANDYGLVSANEGNILHAWNWSLKNIKAQLPEIAAAGYSIVQTSPLQVSDYQDEKSAPDNKGWWKAYQPYDYAYGSVYGSEEEFKELCAEAKKYGISIIVDVVANHMASMCDNNVFVLKAGVNDFWKNNQGTYFHNNDNRAFGTQYDRPNNDTKDGKPCYNSDKDRYATVFFNIGVKDVNTENADVQARMLKYLEQLVADGAGGFRFDAIKHIGTSTEEDAGEGTKSDFWVNTVKKVQKENPELLIYGETLNTVAVSTSKYVADGLKITESQKGWNLKDILQKKTITSQSDMFTYARSSEGVSNDNIIDWVENHDTYLNYWGCTGLDYTKPNGDYNYMDDKQIMLGWSALASREGTQSLFFSRPDGCHLPETANPSNDDTNKIDGDIATLTSNKTWKDAKVAAVNKFKNAMIGEKEDCSVKGNAAIIKRGNKGVVVTNFSDSEATVEVSGLTGLADGTYEDASGQNGTITVSGGKASIKVKGTSFVVLYDAKATPVSTAAPEATTVAATEAPSETASITVDKKDGSTFTEAMTVKVTASNAEKAYYSYDGADWKEFTGSASVTVGKEELVAGDQVGLYVAAFGKDGKLVKESCVYTKASKGSTGSSTTTAGENTIIAKLPSGWANMYIYAYGEGEPTKEYTGKWPGNTMTKGSDGNYTYTLSGVDGSAKVIFNDGNNNQDPAAQQPGHTFEAGKAYSYADGKFTPVEVSTATAEPATGTKKAVEPKEWPTYEVENENVPSVKVDQKSGTSFDEETLDVTITVKNADSAYYTIDGGVQKSFKDSATVAVGQGKIADTEVTLQVVATKGTEKTTETYTYKKVFNQAKAAKKQTVKTAAFTRIQSIMDVVAEAAQVSADAESDAFYVTNPNNNVGKNATITGMSDFTEDMLIARAGAWDCPNAWNGAHENSVADAYGLYGAWDDNNLYIGMEFVNTTDTWHAPGDGPLLDGGKMSNIPVILALNTGKGNAMTGKCPEDKTGHIWQCALEFETRVDNIFISSAQGTSIGTPGWFTGDSNGDTDYTGGHCANFKENGITMEIEDGSISKSIYMLEGSSNVADRLETSKYVDAMTKNHDRKYDTFYTYTIPLKALGIDKAYLESNGVGAMAIGTRQTSALDCVPHDPSMLDNVMLPYTVTNDNTSHEKEDLDIITVPLAAVGSTKAIGNGGGGSLANIGNSGGSTTKATTAPTATEKASDTKATEKPSTSDSATAKPTTSGDLTVNFGADRSSPQYNTTALTLKAIAYGGAKSYSYEFYVDGEVVQKSSSTDHFKWTGSAGSHKIKVIVEDSDGKKVSCEKNFVLEKNGTATDVPSISNGELKLTYKNSAGKSQYVKKAIEFEMDATGGTGKYTYTITAKSSASNAKTIVLLHSSESNSCTWTPTKAGKYAITYCVKDSNNNVIVEKETITIKAIDVLKFTSSKTSVKKGQKIKFSMNAKSVECKASKLKYKLYAKLGKKTVLIRNFSKSKTYTWKTKKKGTYKVYLVVKDTSGNTKTVKLSKTIKVK